MWKHPFHDKDADPSARLLVGINMSNKNNAKSLI